MGESALLYIGGQRVKNDSIVVGRCTSSFAENVARLDSALRICQRFPAHTHEMTLAEMLTPDHLHTGDPYVATISGAPSSGLGAAASSCRIGGRGAGQNGRAQRRGRGRAEAKNAIVAKAITMPKSEKMKPSGRLSGRWGPGSRLWPGADGDTRLRDVEARVSHRGGRPLHLQRPPPSAPIK